MTTASTIADDTTEEFPAAIEITELVSGWDYKQDSSERASAPGILYLVDSNGIQEIERLYALTGNLLSRLIESLDLDQKIVCVAQFDRYRDEPPIQIVHIAKHAVWIIRNGSAHKVRGIHQVSYKERRDYRDPFVLVDTYHVHGTSLSYPFLEPAQVFEVLN